MSAPSSGHLQGMLLADEAAEVSQGGLVAPPASRDAPREGDGVETLDPRRLQTTVLAEHDFLWRSLRRLGVPECDVDDGVQKVLTVFARRLADVAPGKERAFLFQIAVRVASEMRRARARARLELDERPLEAAVATGPTPEQNLERRQARALLDEALDTLDPEARGVFVLFELEELTTGEIATMLDIPAGTVSSRLRRGREAFARAVQRLRAHARGGRP